ncbi:hypothetical protein jhhlp_006336 [Lomentospora prolificans]|uniref:NADP-dependent oxidoreductase domain-containing protein n=1 Tax=Lomentospora prolificans TaxID=41688 RepID=A0A2N3N5M3_9PEZI|nr:hypothetical protein jhhlp_006336 [Lomentospora prolificans]
MPLVVPRPNNRIILGLMTFGPDTETGARITDIGEFNNVLDYFQSRGYNEVDTARMYVGKKQEAFTREAKWKERGLTLATKVIYPSEPAGNAPDKVLESVEASLKDLGTDTLDILYLHAADRETPFAQTLEAIDKLHKAGKFVKFALSNFTSFEVAEIVLTCKYNNWVRPTLYQGMYNCITRGIERELIHACRRYGLDIVVYNPIAGGLLTGRIKSAADIPTDGRFSDSVGRMGGMYRARYFRESTFNALQVIEEAAKKNGLSMTETALRWLVHHSALNITDGNDGILIGASSLQQLESNLNDLEKGPLPDEVVEATDRAWAITQADAVPYYHKELKYGYNTQDVLFGANSK